MDVVGFWALIADCRIAAPEGGTAFAETLIDRLRGQSPAEILSFQKHWDEAHDRLFTWPVDNAATLLLGRFGDDSFLDVRAWIITHGRDVFERVADDPDSLADLVGDQGNAFVESFGAIAYRAYVAATGVEPPPNPGPRGPYGLAGERIDLDNEVMVGRRFPRLAHIRAQQQTKSRPMDPPERLPHAHFRCPSCGNALSLHSYSYVERGADDEWLPQVQIRRCVACLGFAVRYGEGDWTTFDVAGFSGPPQSLSAL